MMERGFDLVLRSPTELPEFNEYRFRSIAELVSTHHAPTEADRPVIVGPVGDAERVVVLADLHRAAAAAAGWARRYGFVAGDSVLLIRLPLTSEVPGAVALFGLMAAGLRVVLPMTVTSHVGRMIDATGCRAVIRWIGEPKVLTNSADAVSANARIREAADSRGLSLHCVSEVLESPAARLPDVSPDQEILVLFTSGSSGVPKGVRYTTRALLTCAESWLAAGLLDADTTGGPSLCPLLSHSMGVRNVLNAIFTRCPTLLLYPEWVTERPDLVGHYLSAWPPRHVTAGPALLHNLARGMCQDPKIGRVVRRHMRCLVSSGSGFDLRLREQLPGVRLANAFGMTETQQVLNSLLGSSEGAPERLGSPLPGVEIGLRYSAAGSSHGRLFVHSPFGSNGYVGRPNPSSWFDTGDRVGWNGVALTYIGRANADFLNTGLGVKSAFAELDRRYAGVSRDLESLVFFSSPSRSGPVAIGFVGDADPADPRIHSRVREAIAARHEAVGETWMDPLEAIGLTAGQPSVRGIGKIDREAISSDHVALLTSLDNSASSDPRLVTIPPTDRSGSAFRRHAYPRLGTLLESTGMDRSYIAGKGNWLTSDEPREDVLDLVGGYGANLLGHGHPEILAAAHRALDRVPLLDQGSVRRPAGELAKTLSNCLSRETGRRFVVCLASTGAEAVELALRHALLARRERFAEHQRRLRREFGPTHPVETDACLAHNEAIFAARRPILIALRGGFHGQTGGALHALGSESRRRPFADLLGLRTVFLGPTGDSDSRELLRQTSAKERFRLRTLSRRGDELLEQDWDFPDILAVLAEPILGEGGIIEVPTEWLAELKRTDAPLVIDEIQTGLGRTGDFLASRGVTADYYLLGKSLGGGVAKLAALAVDREQYREEFDELRPSTFSDDSLSAEVGYAVLTVIDREDVPIRAARAGRLLRERLEELRALFPEVVRSVRGRGLMLGLELGIPPNLDVPFLTTLGRDRLGYMAASYLLNRHRVRVLPSLSAPDVLRLEPSAFLTAAEIDHLVAGFAAFCRGLATGDWFELTRHLVTRDTADPSAFRGTAPYRPGFDTPPDGAARVGFVFPSIQPDLELIAAVPAVQALTSAQRTELIRRLHQLQELRPFVLYTRRLFNGRVWLAGVMVPVLPEALDHFRSSGDTELLRDRIETAIRLAAELGCRTVVLGGQTSSVTADATAVRPPVGVKLSTGNTFTVAVAASRLIDACREIGVTGADSADRVAVVGAAGNIGSALARVLARTALGRRLLLVGRRRSAVRLDVDAEAIRQAHPSVDVMVSTRLADVIGSNVVVVATSGSLPVLLPEHVASDRPVVVLDVSQPHGVSPRMKRERPLARVSPVGLVRLPVDPDFRASPFTPPGAVFACLAEAVLLGLGAPADRLTGPIDSGVVKTLARFAKQSGFNVPHRFD
jgi:acetylornithine/succinyldiaminopimelate/putrescine aminotransferase/predicted amino acid dehydrogenase/acyl-coenzyme A synthetase/AMP-(fatty) acid ligase